MPNNPVTERQSGVCGSSGVAGCAGSGGICSRCGLVNNVVTEMASWVVNNNRLLVGS